MGKRNIKRAIRMILGAACTTVGLLLALQYFSLKDTAAAAQEALALKEQIGPEMEASVLERDQTLFEELGKSSLFGRTPRQKVEPPKLDGRLGPYAILNGRMVGPGDPVDKIWKLESISDKEVVIVRIEDEREIKHQFALPQNRGLVIDNRSKEQRKEINPARPGAPRANGRSDPRRPGGSPGASGANGAAMSPGVQRAAAGQPSPGNTASNFSREQFAKMRGTRGGAASTFERRGAAGANVDWANMSVEEIERLIRERNGGQLPPSFNREEIQKKLQKARRGREPKQSP